jgi:hypothetical protein
MAKKRATATLLLLSVFAACWPEAEWTDLRRGATGCVIAVFPEGATTEEINAFLKEHTQAPTSPRGGEPLRPGIGALIKRNIQGQIGYEICFTPDADPAQKSAILDGIRNSPVLDHVLEGEQAEQAVN